MVRKLKREPELWKKLSELVNGYRAKGFLREVKASERRLTNYSHWMLPVFSMHNPNKPEKVRLVWDAAAKVNGVSLNDPFLAGPDLNSPLVNVLRFRKGKIAISGDLQEMFLQLVVREEDRGVQQFLWQGYAEETKVYEVNRVLFGFACSPTLAQFVKNTNALRFQN